MTIAPANEAKTVNGDSGPGAPTGPDIPTGPAGGRDAGERGGGHGARPAGEAGGEHGAPGPSAPAGDGVGERAGTSERAREGVEHLQAAARELIEAARALLDVAEDLVEDPETVTQFVGAVGTLGSLVRDATGIGGRTSGPQPARSHGPGPGPDRDGEDCRPGRPAGPGPGDSGLQRIPVL